MSEPKRDRRNFRSGFCWGATTVACALELVTELQAGFSWFGAFMMTGMLLGLALLLDSLLPSPTKDPLADYRKP